MKCLFVAILFSLFCFLIGCKPEPEPEITEKTQMLAILNRPPGYPKDFKTDLIKAYYFSNSHVMQIDGMDPFSRDRLKIKCETSLSEVVGTYSIGEFNLPETKTTATFLSDDLTLAVESQSGTLSITRFDSTGIPNQFLLYGSFSFSGNGDVGPVEVSSGEMIRVEILLQ